MKEQGIQAKILKYIQAKGGYAVNVITASKSGVPDILGCIDGRFIGIEVKKGNNTTNNLQKENLLLIKDAGGFACSVNNLEDLAKEYTLWVKTR